MTRPLRIEYSGALYHVTSRGDRRENIYHDDGDRLIWLKPQGQVLQTSIMNFNIHFFFFMMGLNFSSAKLISIEFRYR